MASAVAQKTSGPPRPLPRPPGRRRKGTAPRRLPYLLIAPAVLLMLGFIAYPVLSVFYYSAQHYNPTKPWRNGFAGWENFTAIFTEDTHFWGTLAFSLKWVSVEVSLQLLFGLALALIVNQTFVG
ncbi:carbohydrate ABC transporter permease, partial [Streptomyces zhihengii]